MRFPRTIAILGPPYKVEEDSDMDIWIQRVEEFLARHSILTLRLAYFREGTPLPQSSNDLESWAMDYNAMEQQRGQYFVWAQCIMESITNLTNWTPTRDVRIQAERDRRELKWSTITGDLLERSGYRFEYSTARPDELISDGGYVRRYPYGGADHERNV